MLRSWRNCPSTLVTSCRQPSGGSVGDDENRRGARAYHLRLPRGWLLALAEDRSARGDVGMRASVSAKPTSTTASSTTPTTIATTTATSSEASHLGKAGVDVLLGLLQDVDKLTSLLLVCAFVSIKCLEFVRYIVGILTVSSEKGNGGTLRAGTTSTTNSVDVILRVVGIIVVQHVSDIANILIPKVSRRSGCVYSNFPARGHEERADKNIYAADSFTP